MTDQDGTPGKRRAMVEMLATLENVGLLGCMVRAAASLADLAGEALDDVEIGVVEAATNIVQHAYGGAGGTLSVGVTVERGRIALELVDRGRPMEEPATDRAMPSADPMDLDGLPASGMGMPLIEATFDVVRYSRDGDANRLLLIRGSAA